MALSSPTVSGAFSLNSGLAKRPVEPEAAAHLHGFATTAHPEFKNMDPKRFVNLLSLSEIALGSAPIAPIVPSWVAGTELALFSAGLLRLYLRHPG